MKKIIIIGGNGSGKTTFAKQLNRELDIPLILLIKYIGLTIGQEPMRVWQTRF